MAPLAQRPAKPFPRTEIRRLTRRKSSATPATTSYIPPSRDAPSAIANTRLTPRGASVKEIVETKDGDVARLIEKDGKPLPPEEEQAEIDRLNNLLAHPEIQEHRHKKEQEDSARGDEMVRMLPDAFLFTFDGMVEGPNGPLLPLEIQAEPRIYAPRPGR